MKRIFLLLIYVLILSVSSIYAQDNIKVLQYNLLYYGLNETGCDNYNNNINTKTNYIKTIISYLEPDIFAVNEIGDEDNIADVHDYLLWNAFSNNGFDNYSRGEVHDEYYNLTSQIYYNSNKLTLKKTDYISSWPRDIHVYKFYYNSPDLTNGDTVYFTYYVAHLKAGDTDDDIGTRNTQANDIMSYINYYNATDNYILSGDLNLYSNNEGAYQRLTNYSNSTINFIDINEAGEWHNNSQYSNIHTQSSFYSSNDGCGASGGLDDRFDFILFSQSINNGSNQMSYSTNSFETIGQDGQHFNDGVSYNGNTSVPADVLTALANNSDHLPVYAEFTINQTPASFNTTNSNNTTISYKENNLTINTTNTNLAKTPTTIEIFDINGRTVFSQTKQLNQTTTINTTLQKNNIYIVRLKNNTNHPVTKKIIVK